MVRKTKCSCGEELFVNQFGNHFKLHPECKIKNEELKRNERPFVCLYCGNRFKKEAFLNRHLRNDCKLVPENAKPKSSDQILQEENEKIGVKCELCNRYFKELGNHLTQSHKISKNEYCEKFNLSMGDLHSEVSHLLRSETNKINGSKAAPIVREKKKDPEYVKQIGENIRRGILNSELAIQIRKETMTRLNKSEEYRKKDSERMKNTWKNNDEMSKLSHQWQKDDPDKLNRVLETARSVPKKRTLKSKPEKEIRRWLKEDLGYKLNSGRFFIEEHHRFFDIHIGDVLIEIDGPWHFEEFFFKKDGTDKFKNGRFHGEVDKLKEQFAIENGYYLLRVSNWGDKIEDQKEIIKTFLEQKHLLQKNIYKRGRKYD